MMAEPAEVSLVCVLFPACFVPRADYAATHANGFCINAHQRNASKRAFTCVKMRRSCTPHTLLITSTFWMLLRDVLLYLPDKIEQNMALGIRTYSVAIYASSKMYIKQACHVNSLIFLITSRLFR
jgi:hypothetical protein